MAYLSDSIVSGCVWYNYNYTTSVSGTRLDVIFGNLGIGNPHGHAVYFNDLEIFQRTLSGLMVNYSGSTIAVLQSK